jgi:hypothetical protein
VREVFPLSVSLTVGAIQSYQSDNNLKQSKEKRKSVLGEGVKEKKEEKGGMDVRREKQGGRNGDKEIQGGRQIRRQVEKKEAKKAGTEKGGR